ncbi:hypothetical protein, partial [Saccharopolyspora sp. NPDC002578]
LLQRPFRGRLLVRGLFLVPYALPAGRTRADPPCRRDGAGRTRSATAGALIRRVRHSPPRRPAPR